MALALVRPYRVTLQVGDPLNPTACMAHVIETEAFDASDALQQAGILAEGELGLFSKEAGLVVKALRVDPNVPAAMPEQLTAHVLEMAFLLTPLKMAESSAFAAALLQFFKGIGK